MGGLDYERIRFASLERACLEPPGYDKAMQAYDEYADNDAWLAEMFDYEYESVKEGRLIDEQANRL